MYLYRAFFKEFGMFDFGMRYRYNCQDQIKSNQVVRFVCFIYFQTVNFVNELPKKTRKCVVKHFHRFKSTPFKTPASTINENMSSDCHQAQYRDEII